LSFECGRDKWREGMKQVADEGDDVGRREKEEDDG
jgi:hypothetical protein